MEVVFASLAITFLLEIDDEVKEPPTCGVYTLAASSIRSLCPESHSSTFFESSNDVAAPQKPLTVHGCQGGRRILRESQAFHARYYCESSQQHSSCQ